MSNWVDGLFAGGDNLDLPDDNFGLERWFKAPKGHERRINGHKHAGTRMVYEGATLMPTLDVHRSMEKPFKAEDLLPYVDCLPPDCEIEAQQRRTLMKLGNSKKKDQKR